MSEIAAIDALWQRAPCAALRLGASAGPPYWMLNQAAIEWSLRCGWTEADWDEAVNTLSGERSTAPSGTLFVASCGIDYRSVALPEGRLLWLCPQPGVAGPWPDGWRGAREKLALVQGFERIGFFERRLGDGRGGRDWWDRYMYKLMGLPLALNPPTFEQALLRVHPQDRERVIEHHRQAIQRAGRYEVRYRLAPPDAPPRDVQVLTEVRNGADGSPATLLGVLIDDTEGAQRERAQRSVSDELARALELARVSVWRVDVQRRRMFFNDIGYRFNGIEPTSKGMALDDVRALAHDEDRPAIIDAAARAMAGDEVIDVEARYRNPDGSWRHLLTRRVAERDAQGQVVALLGVSLDQSEQIAARLREQALARRIQMVSDAAGVGVWNVEEGVAGAPAQVEWNAQMLRICGMAPGQPAPSLQAWIGQVIHPHDRERALADGRGARESGSGDFDTELRIVRPDGSVRWVLCRSHFELRDGRGSYHGIYLDLTPQRALQAQLRLHEHRLKLATQSAGVGIWDSDLDSGEVIWEEQMYRLRGLRPDDPRTPHDIDRDLLAPWALQERRRRFDRHLADAEPYEHEFELRWPDGSTHWLASTGCAVRDADGKPLRMVGLNWDVTQRKRADAALRDAEAAERASRAKSQFLARMSHELRTPLNAILGFAQLLEHDVADRFDARQRERLQRIRSAGLHLLGLIEEVLDLSAVEAGSLALTLQTIDLDQAVDEVRHWLAPMAAAAGLALQVTPARACVRADARRLRQVLGNLVSNAIKYNRRGGRVTLSSQRVLVDGVPGWELTVRDTGRGLSTEQQAHLYEPFNRLGAEREDIEGRGIGLVTVHHLVQAMGGRLRQQSRLGEGSEFFVWLPQSGRERDAAGLAETAVGTAGRDDIEGGANGAPRHAAASGAALSLLYIEDDPVSALVMRELVGLRANFSLHVATDGAAGIEAARRLRPDLVLTDMHLPDMDGLELLRRLRALPRTATVIALSANAMPDAIAQARAAGFDDYWTKPVDIQRLLAGLDRLAAFQPAQPAHAAAVPLRPPMED